MAHIALDEDLPGIIALWQFRPETAAPLKDLADALLRGPNTLARAERELIGAYVSNRNHCVFCARAHSAIACEQFGDGADGRDHWAGCFTSVLAGGGARGAADRLPACQKETVSSRRTAGFVGSEPRA